MGSAKDTTRTTAARPPQESATEDGSSLGAPLFGSSSKIPYRVRGRRAGESGCFVIEALFAGVACRIRGK